MPLRAAASGPGCRIAVPQRPAIISAREVAPMPADAVERKLTAIRAAGWYRHSFGALILTGVVCVLFAVNPASSANYSECMAQAVGMSGDARQQFMAPA